MNATGVLTIEQLGGGVALVRMQRPEKLNALNPELLGALNAYFGGLSEGEYETRAVVLTGAGRAFCAGGDFTPRDAAAPAPAWRRAHPERESIRFIRDCDVPVIGAINGFAFGGGFSLALACDLRIAADDAQFQVAQMRRGIVPEYGLSYFLQEQVGRQRALELMYTARRVDAAEALQLGLVLEVVPRGELEVRAVALATAIAAGPPLGMAVAKRLVHAVEDEALARVQELSIAYIRSLQGTADGIEGARSFVERREPVFRGR
ncbi:MAG: enoyl-CoA hydratase/isomerase family protein [Dehalococcoidia bacterium]|nr:enoyl-CoA hydratase/isomerase family protein [Dehalococcoidia bacterium]